MYVFGRFSWVSWHGFLPTLRAARLYVFYYFISVTVWINNNLKQLESNLKLRVWSFNHKLGKLFYITLRTDAAIRNIYFWLKSKRNNYNYGKYIFFMILFLFFTIKVNVIPLNFQKKRLFLENRGLQSKFFILKNETKGLLATNYLKN